MKSSLEFSTSDYQYSVDDFIYVSSGVANLQGAAKTSGTW
jgi:hypothetical protein